MQKRKMVITHNLDECLIQKIKETVPEWELVIGKDRTVWQNHLKDAEIIAGWKKEMEEFLEENIHLRWLQSWSAGVDDLPLEKLAESKILLTSANGVHVFPISETIFALMLALTRKIHTYIRNQQSKTWHHSGLKLELHQKTVGIIGVGAIGKETAKIAKAFGMNVLGVRRSGKPEEFVDEMFTTDHLSQILPKCDYVAVTLPLTKDTRHLFGKEQFVLMKPSAFFINIGRGEVVNEAELIQALQDGQIAGAGLDVFETEPLDESSPLWDMENVIITPHTAGSTEHYNKRVIEDIFIPNLKSYLEGKTPTVNLVDYEKGY
ncbi:D-isomer specific 2-hydroxyacid dehydrogenase NAD-binding protein [Bacillus methanolicus PB1]|uniref:D-isomer specific 2-hydroxyacid dehydrogenase NAD-binding protein n=1 Tax=Bacillus methanolicus PB1 TaxID=997296 RepID=I3E6S6_BACMT|nr:D-2-hydroxyacid dehydrogenase [Bacillus methanolicus]EIJ82197.1 D-isomer specific 2-hydroxyacid dehydrogenase NAD-binding protein [Bacillus methanolicus PB1]